MKQMFEEDKVNWYGIPPCPICKGRNVTQDDESNQYGCLNCTFIWRIKRD